MKKIFLLLLLLATVLTLATACAGGGDDVSDGGGNTDTGDGSNTQGEIKIGIAFETPDGATVDVGKTLALKVKNLETGMQTSNLLWKSDAPEIASVDSRGTVTGITQGSANITATTLDGKYSATCKISVMLRLSGVQLSYEDYDLEIGDSVQLEAMPIPENFIGATCTWLSSVPSVASVDENGLVTAHALGTTSIMVSAEPGGHTAICSIRVGKYADSIELDMTECIINKGVSMQLTYTMLPEDATSRPHWRSSDESIAIVNSGGGVTAIACGEAIITVTTTNGLEATCKLTVVSALTGFEFKYDEVTVAKGSEAVPKINFFPADATNKNMIWTSSDENILVVEDGVMKALETGVVTLTAESEDGGYIRTMTVNVNNPLVSIELEGEKDPTTGKYPPIQMECTDEIQLPVIFNPFDADEIPELEWISSNVNVATVSPDGRVTAHTIGNVTVTVSAPNGVSTTVEIVVNKKIYPVKEFSAASDKYYMNPSDLLKITFTYMPIESGEDAVISSAVSSDPTVADWNAEASTVVAHAIGECEIEFTVLNRDGTDAKCKVKIYVVEAGGSYDDEYKDDTHALRDAFAERMSIINEKLAGLKSSEISLLDAIAALRDIIANTPVVPDPGEDTEPDAGVDPDTGTDDEEGTLPEENTGDFDETEGEDTEEENPAPEPDPNVVLLKQYEERLVEIRLEIAQTESDIAECKAKLARDEAGLAEKYSCVAEDITYDPSADTYPEKADSDFVKVSDYIKDATVDLEYARADNDIGQRVYGFSDAYLRYGTVKKLVSVADMLSGLGYKIVITEAYRPTAAQDRMWELLGLESEAYGGFCKGNALCITLVNADGTPADDTDGGLTFLLSMQMTDKGFAAGEGEGCFVDTVDYTVEESFLSDVAVFNENTEITE